MKFIPLESAAQIDEIKNAHGLQAIFKHNTTCPISKSVRAQFEQEAGAIPGLTGVYFLDLLAHRDISDDIAARFGIPHESPQLLLIRDGQCIYNAALYDINAADAADAAA
jgi:bacillithiol system protein YtxJ